MGQVCAKHNEFYETECRYCPKRFEGYDILQVSAQIPVFKKVRDPSFAEYLGAEEIGPQESKFWMDFISQDFCADQPATVVVPAPPTAPTARPILISGILYSPCITSFPNDGHGSLE